jgi:3-phosphoglycerate kinase
MAAAAPSSMKKLAVNAVSLAHKRVLMRVDFNVPFKDVRALSVLLFAWRVSQ